MTIWVSHSCGVCFFFLGSLSLELDCILQSPWRSIVEGFSLYFRPGCMERLADLLVEKVMEGEDQFGV